MALLQPRLDEYPQPPGIVRPRSAGQSIALRARPSLRQRSTRLEENILKNLERMREQREMTDFVRLQRQQDTDKQLREMQDLCKAPADEPGLQERDRIRPPRELGVGNMKERCAALEEYVDCHAAVLKGHREALDQVHAARRQKRVLLGLSPDEEEVPAATAPLPPRPAPASAWAELASTAPAAAQVTPAEPVSQAAPAEPLARSLGQPQRSRSVGASGPSRPPTAGSASVPTRPPSAAAVRQSTARSLGGTGAVASYRAGSPRDGTPGVGYGSRGSSRPPSAGSLNSRCAALQANALRNQKALETNKLELSIVIKLREEGRRRVLESLQGTFA